MDETTNVLTPPPPPPPPPSQPPQGPPPRRTRLVRRTDHKVVGGVCAGLGDHFEVDPVLFRVIFVVLTIAGGAGLILYGLAWWIIPPAYGPTAPLTDSAGQRTLDAVHRRGGWFGVALLIAGAALVLHDVGEHGPLGWLFRPGIVWGAALILFGVLLYQRAGERRASRERSRQAGVEAGLPRPPASNAEEPASFATTAAGSAGPVAAPAPPTAAAGGPILPPAWPDPIQADRTPRPHRRRRERSSLGWITLGFVLLALGVAALLDQAGTVHVSADRYLALALAVMGLGLLIGTWWGRSRGLIALGILLIPLVLAASLIEVPLLTGGAGDRFYQPASVGDIQAEYHLGAGQLDLDLRNVSFADASTTTVTATVGLGRLLVVVPSDVAVTIHGLSGAGEVSVQSVPFDPADHRVDGIRAQLDQAYGSSIGATMLVLNLKAGFGQIQVFREAPDSPPPPPSTPPPPPPIAG